MTDSDTTSEAPTGADATSTDVHTEAETLIEAWRSALDGQVSVSASDVQDRLLDLWGRLPEGSTTRTDVESWLTETLNRNLYAVADIDARLVKVMASA